MSTRSERIKALIEKSVMSYQDLEKLAGVNMYIGKFSSMTPSVTPSNNRNKEKRPSVEGLFFVTVPQSR